MSMMRFYGSSFGPNDSQEVLLIQLFAFFTLHRVNKLLRKKDFINKLSLSLDYVTTKYPNVGICLTGDKNDLKLDFFLKNNKLKQLVSFPTTKGGTSLDVICSNLSEYYQNPQELPPLGGRYHFMLHWNPLPSYKIIYVIETF